MGAVIGRSCFLSSSNTFDAIGSLLRNRLCDKYSGFCSIRATRRFPCLPYPGRLFFSLICRCKMAIILEALLSSLSKATLLALMSGSSSSSAMSSVGDSSRRAGWGEAVSSRMRARRPSSTTSSSPVADEAEDSDLDVTAGCVSRVLWRTGVPRPAFVSAAFRSFLRAFCFAAYLFAVIAARREAAPFAEAVVSETTWVGAAAFCGRGSISPEMGLK
mmetsp:Transcript_8458/g.20770  ORF Transcript_8458/g.20770 Transcript_8458/m.20770 type:complete len:217 (+) Transcript_8458:78-728(+)